VQPLPRVWPLHFHTPTAFRTPSNLLTAALNSVSSESDAGHPVAYSRPSKAFSCLIFVSLISAPNFAKSISSKAL
jgi:hypothetical protein